MSPATQRGERGEGLPRVAVVGGGFGGLCAARALAGGAVQVTLIDRKNHHTFQPLLYQVALSVLATGDIAGSLRHILRGARNVRTLLGEVVGFDTPKRRVLLRDGGAVDYDYLIVAAGARHAYFGHDAWEAEAPGLKTIEDAIQIRNRLLAAFERAEREAMFDGRTRPVSFAIVGGGPTGVELAGAIADLARLVLAKDFRAIDTKQTRVLLYEGSPRILASYSERSSRRAQQQLAELGVEVHTGSMVTDIAPGKIQVAGAWVTADATLWATGVAASPLGRQLGAETDAAGRVRVASDLSVPGHPEIFAIGDLSTLVDTSGRQVPGLGAAAKQQGAATAANILRELRGQPRLPYRYRDRGSMATIGHHRAIAEIGGLEFSGVVAWLLWSLVHVLLLVTFRNRVSVMGQWAWAYVRREGSSPLITEYSPRGSASRQGGTLSCE